MRRQSRARRVPLASILVGTRLAVVALALGGHSAMVGALAAQTPSMGNLAGTVSARETGAPVAGAAVTVQGTSLATITNVIGRFRLDQVPAGAVTLVVRAPGFLELRVAAGQLRPNETLTVSVVLDATPNYTEHVQVTATKTPVSVGEIAAQADVVDRTTIEARGDLDLPQAIARLPGVMVSTLGVSFQSVMLRGLPRTGNEFTSTLLLIDGVPQTDSRNSARVVNLPIHDAASIEVVRGPNSALYGRTALGGAVNVRTADPTPEHQAAFSFTTGEWGLLRGMGRASGPIGQRAGYYLSAASERHHGYHQQNFDFLVESTALFGKVTFVPDDRSFGSLTFNRVLSDNSAPTDIPVIDGRPLTELDPRFHRFTNLNLPTALYHQEESRLTASYTRELSPRVRGVNVLGYRAIQYKFVDDGDVIGGPFDLNASTLTMYPFEQQNDEDILYEELRFEIGPLAEPNRGTLVAGGSYERHAGFIAGNLIYTDPDLLGWRLNYRNPVFPAKSEWRYFPIGGHEYHMDVLGLFALYTTELDRRWTFTAAGRYDRLTLDNTLTFRPGRPRVDATFDAFSPKLTAAYKLVDLERPRASLVVYGTYSQAFLPPRRPTQLVPSDVQVNLQPEDIDNYELGLKGTWLDGRAVFDATYFRMTHEGIVTTLRQGPFFLPTNAGVQRYRGIEASLQWRASPVASAYANAAIYRNRYGTFIIQSARGDIVLTGNRLPISPNWVLNYGITLGPVGAFDATVTVKHVSDVYADQRNRLRFDPYTIVDTALGFRRGPVRVTVAAHNLFNAAYFTYGDLSNAESANPGRPRQVVVSVSSLFR